MSKPKKPIEAQGLGCGLIVSTRGMTIAPTWFGVPAGVLTRIAVVFAAISLVAY